MLKINQYLKTIWVQLEHYILIDINKPTNTNMIIIVPKPFKMSAIYPELRTEIIFISQKAYFLEKPKEKLVSTFSQE